MAKKKEPIKVIGFVKDKEGNPVRLDSLPMGKQKEIGMLLHEQMMAAHGFVLVGGPHEWTGLDAPVPDYVEGKVNIDVM